MKEHQKCSVSVPGGMYSRILELKHGEEDRRGTTVSLQGVLLMLIGEGLTSVMKARHEEKLGEGKKE